MSALPVPGGSLRGSATVGMHCGRSQSIAVGDHVCLAEQRMNHDLAIDDEAGNFDRIHAPSLPAEPFRVLI
jgi:hypothetical protein